MYHYSGRDSNPAQTTWDHTGSNGRPSAVLTRHSPMLSGREEPQLGEVITPETGELDAIKTSLAIQPRSWDVNMLHKRQATLRQADHSHWCLIITVAACTLTLLLFLYCYARTQWHYLFLCNSPKKSPRESNPAPMTTSSPTSTPENTVQALRRITSTTMSLLQPTRCNTQCEKTK